MADSKFLPGLALFCSCSISGVWSRSSTCVCGCSCGAGSEEGLNRRHVQKERKVEIFDLQSLYASLMFLCFLQKQKAGVRIGTYFLAAHFLF